MTRPFTNAGGGGLDNGDGESRVLVTVPPLCPPSDWRRMGEMLLEGSYGVGGIYLANKSVLSMYGGGRTTGVCVDSGEDMGRSLVRVQFTFGSLGEFESLLAGLLICYIFALSLGVLLTFTSICVLSVLTSLYLKVNIKRTKKSLFT